MSGWNPEHHGDTPSRQPVSGMLVRRLRPSCIDRGRYGDVESSDVGDLG